MKNKNSPGIKEIAKLAGVSIGTIDRVLHNRPGVSEKTKQKVLKIIQKTGYKKNILASRLKLAATRKIQIACLIPEIKDEFSYWKLPQYGINKAVEELKEQGISVSYYYFNSFDPSSFEEQSNEILKREYDAIISVPFFKSESDLFLQKLEEFEIAVVFLDSRQELNFKANYINQDSFKAGQVAGRLLEGLLKGKGLYFVINILNERGIQVNNLQREQGFRAYFEKKSRHSQDEIYTINLPFDDHVDLQEVIPKLIERQEPKGIFVTNARSFRLLDLLANYDDPELYLVGFDLNEQNLAYLNAGKIQFLINQKPEYQGYAAVKGLYKFLTSQDQTELNIDIPIDIIVRENAEFYMNGHLAP
ncbi:MAG: LacI family DNA-binding transcriptional regulator [Bacteroidia bacterium]|nr:LacI family DNA-binding transcriptional regulator [Bacteroidia bacterium]